MATQQTAAPSMSAYFCDLFEANKTWLRQRSNTTVGKRWLADHPGESAMPDNVKNAMSNVKSVLRQSKRKRQKAAVDASTNHLAEKAPAAPKVSKLEKLEIQIDECRTLAKGIDPQGLDHVIRLLRNARDEVVWKQGQ